MDRPTIAKEAAKRLVGAELQLQNLQTEVTKYIDQDDDAVESYYRAFLDVIYSFQQHIKQQEPHYDTCLAKLNSFDRQYIESMWNKRTDPAHGNSQIKIKLLEKSIRAELVPGVTVFGPLLPLIGQVPPTGQVNEAGALPPTWLAAVKVKTYYVSTKFEELEVTEACRRCIAILEQLLAK